MTEPLVITEPLGGSALAQAAAQGAVFGGWYVDRPGSAAGWEQRARAARKSVSSGWLDALRPAFSASGRAAERLEAVAEGRGVVVTTGQQPGLFGGPIYTWSKALSAIAFAEALERSIGMPVAPVFWAATDDSDFAEASWTMVARSGGAEELRIDGEVPNMSMAHVPLGDVSVLLERFERAAGSTAWPEPIQLVRRSYRPGETIGGAYLALLRGLLEPLGMAVIDAAHPSVRRVGSSLLREALRRSERIATALSVRDRALLDAGHVVQVASVGGLSLVFRVEDGTRKRVKHAEATALAESASDDGLSANVLLRPVLERAILPTIAYVAGPAEISYFAQVSAVADALGAAPPLALPRWSCTILEPHIARILERLELAAEDLRDPHAAETKAATESLPPGVAAAFARMSAATSDGLDALGTEDPGLVRPEVVEGARRALAGRLARLERRYRAAMKRRLSEMLQDIGTARGALFPGGKRQERALNLMPLLARHGRPLLDAMQDAARVHAAGIIEASADSSPPSRMERGASGHPTIRQ